MAVMINTAKNIKRVCTLLNRLAEIIKVPAANLVATVDRYNKFVEQNYDADFGQFKKFLTQKIQAGPFYAMPKTYYRHAGVGGSASTSMPRSWTDRIGSSPGFTPRAR